MSSQDDSFNFRDFLTEIKKQLREALTIPPSFLVNDREEPDTMKCPENKRKNTECTKVLCDPEGKIVSNLIDVDADIDWKIDSTDNYRILLGPPIPPIFPEDVEKLRRMSHYWDWNHYSSENVNGSPHLIGAINNPNI